MSKSVERVIADVVGELWGWHPNGKTLTPEQQLGCVREELGHQLRAHGHKASSQEVRESKDGTHGLVVEVIANGAVYIKAFPPASRSEYTMQADSEETLDGGAS